jgi:hypothetical protein
MLKEEAKKQKAGGKKATIVPQAPSFLSRKKEKSI